jgi:hypothetical protein
MGLFTKRLIGGLTAALVLAVGASADFLLTNFDRGDNVSEMGTYFYMYSSVAADADKVENNGPDEYGPLSYKAFQGGNGGTGYSAGLVIAELPGHLAAADPGGPYYPGFGFGILISGDDDVGYADFQKVDAVEFYARSSSTGVTVIFKVETIENSENGPYSADPANAYATTFKPTATWTKYTIPIQPITPATGIGTVIGETGSGGLAGELKQFPYWGYSFTFDRKNVTKIAWAINADNNASLKGEAANVYIDDVTLVGSFTYTSPDICVGCVSTSFTIPTPNKKLSDFEGTDYVGEEETGPDFLLNSRGYYWFSYDDGEAGGASEIAGLKENPHVEGTYIMDAEGAGRSGTNGAKIDFTPGASFSKPGETVVIAPFVGIGVNVYDDDNTSDFLNASAFTGVYFEFNTSANVNFFDLEITDDLDAVGKAADADGEVLYTKIEGSGGTWKSATVPFSNLVLPTWVATSGVRRQPPNNTLNKSKLAQLKFKHTGPTADGSEASIAIDNVYFYGADNWGEAGSVRLAGSKAKATGLRATYSRGVVGVNWSAAQSVATGKISLVNVRGRVVASAPIKMAGSKVTANLGAGTIPTGMYFVRVNAKDVNGKKIVQQAPLSIVK